MFGGWGTLRHYKLVESLAWLHYCPKMIKEWTWQWRHLHLLRFCVTGTGLSKLEVWVWFNFQTKKMQEKKWYTQIPTPSLATRKQAVSSLWYILPAPKRLLNKIQVVPYNRNARVKFFLSNVSGSKYWRWRPSLILRVQKSTWGIVRLLTWVAQFWVLCANHLPLVFFHVLIYNM